MLTLVEAKKVIGLPPKPPIIRNIMNRVLTFLSLTLLPKLQHLRVIVLLSPYLFFNNCSNAFVFGAVISEEKH